MFEKFTLWLFEQGSIVVSFAIGVLSSYVMISKINMQRFESLEKSIKFLKELLDKTQKDVDRADEMCEKRVQAVMEENDQLMARVQRLEDSRTFILTNQLKKAEEK